MHYTIERDKWYRGEGASTSRLRRLQDGKMCCLGQVAIQNGFTEADITDRTAPGDIYEYRQASHGSLGEIPTDFSWLLRNDDPTYNSHPCRRAMNVNDDMEILDDGREAQLTSIFAEAGHTVTFV